MQLYVDAYVGVVYLCTVDFLLVPKPFNSFIPRPFNRAVFCKNASEASTTAPVPPGWLKGLALECVRCRGLGH